MQLYAKEKDLNQNFFKEVNNAYKCVKATVLELKKEKKVSFTSKDATFAIKELEIITKDIGIWAMEEKLEDTKAELERDKAKLENLKRLPSV